LGGLKVRFQGKIREISLKRQLGLPLDFKPKLEYLPLRLQPRPESDSQNRNADLQKSNRAVVGGKASEG